MQTQMYVGQGVYGIAEAARYTRLNSGRVRNWFKPRLRTGAQPLLNSDLPSVDDRIAVNFLDLIDVLVVGRLRERGVTMPVIRSANLVLRGELGVEHPFCHARICTDGERIFLKVADELGDDKLSDVISRQHFFPQVMDAYLEQIAYSSATALAAFWRIAEGVIVNPSVCMGKPVVSSTGIATYVVANQYHANGDDAGLVADLFNIEVEDVLNAVAFEAEFGVKRAA